MGAYPVPVDDASTFVHRLLELADVQPPPYYHDGHVVIPDAFDAVAQQMVAGGVHPSKSELLDLAALRRWQTETGGITVNGVAVATDRQSQAMLAGAFNMASSDATFKTQWKGANGAFVSVDAAAIIAVSKAVGAHVAACFATEAATAAAIAAGTITSRAQVNAAFA